METLGYYNGKYDELDKMYVPMNDRGFYFGDGFYDATYSRNYIIYSLDDHMERFFNNAKALGINLPMTKEELIALLNDLVKKMKTGENFVYWQVTRGTAPRMHVFDPKIMGNICVMLTPRKIKDVTKDLNVTLIEDTRYLHCNIKTLNLLPSVLAAQKAHLGGFDEAILHRGPEVTECSHSNVHILKNGVFITHPADNKILPGVGRKHLIAKCHKMGIPVEERPFTLDEMWAADEVIASSSTILCVRVDTIDGKKVGGKAGDIVKKLQDAVVADYNEATTPK